MCKSSPRKIKTLETDWLEPNYNPWVPGLPGGVRLARVLASLHPPGQPCCQFAQRSIMLACGEEQCTACCYHGCLFLASYRTSVQNFFIKSLKPHLSTSATCLTYGWLSWQKMVWALCEKESTARSGSVTSFFPVVRDLQSDWVKRETSLWLLSMKKVRTK